MAPKYSVETCRELADRFARQDLKRPMRMDRYESGTELTYDVTGISPPVKAKVRVLLEKFVGGGYAGQVYRSRILQIDSSEGGIAGLEVGSVCAVKILVPPERSAVAFRNALYAVGFQAPFSHQVNPAAARAGALWQKFIRRAAGSRFGTETAVADIYATFVDSTIGSCGEIREWVEGRTWRYEVDDRLFDRWKWKVGEVIEGLGSPEYRAKKQFMHDFVKLLHEMGARELARQYEWWTCKSQPNVMKRSETEGEPTKGHCAVDFRAGLALLPFLPMSPGDFGLILKGVAHGSLVQFDRGDMQKLRRYVEARPAEFADMKGSLNELVAMEDEYRNSMPDVTHNHVRLLYSGKLWKGILDSAVNSWEIRGTVDSACAGVLRRSRLLTLEFALWGLVPLLSVMAAFALTILKWPAVKTFGSQFYLALALLIVVPVLSRFFRRFVGRGDYRRHYLGMLASADYFRRSVRARVSEKLIGWVRTRRVSEARAKKMAEHPSLFFLHLPLSFLPAMLHRVLTDRKFGWDAVRYIVARPIQLYFSADAREQWIRGMVEDGKKSGMLTEEEAARIDSQLKEPFIQKYLKCLAVHVCMAPTTHVVALAVAAWYCMTHPGMSLGEATAATAFIFFIFQVIPMSPGSLLRGLYVLYIVLKEKNYREYKVALWLAFWKYVGYLAFPIQMAYRYPTLSRFMAGSWATGAVHIVPVFGEKGALLEHGIFDVFFNLPVTLRSRSRRKHGTAEEISADK